MVAPRPRIKARTILFIKSEFITYLSPLEYRAVVAVCQFPFSGSLGSRPGRAPVQSASCLLIFGATDKIQLPPRHLRAHPNDQLRAHFVPCPSAEKRPDKLHIR